MNGEVMDATGREGKVQGISSADVRGDLAEDVTIQCGKGKVCWRCLIKLL